MASREQQASHGNPAEHTVERGDSDYRQRIRDLLLLAARGADAAGAMLCKEDTGQVHILGQHGLNIAKPSAATELYRRVCLHKDILTVAATSALSESDAELLRCLGENVRFLAAAPLQEPDGTVTGLLAVFDCRLKELLADQMEALHAAARQAEMLCRNTGSRPDSGCIFPAASRVLLQNLLDSFPDFVYIKDREGRYVCDNRAHREFLGVEAMTDITGKTVEDFFPPDLAERYRTGDDYVLNTGEPIKDREEPLVTPAGSASVVSTSKVPIRDADNRIQGLVCIGRDISHRKEAEDALAQERYLLHALMDNMPDNIYFKDRQKKFIRINNAMARWFGLDDPAEAIGKTDFDFFTAEHAQQAYMDEENIMATGTPLVGKEEKETWPNGHVTWVSTTKEPLRDSSGAIIGCFGISRDITRLKEATNELAERDERTREEMALARKIHRSLLPVEAPCIQGLEFGLRFVPSGDIGGDFVDFLDLHQPHRIGVVFADITGHGVGAALLSSMLKVLVDEVTDNNVSQSTCFQTLNRRLFKEFPQGNFASGFYAVFDSRQHKLSYVKASQEPLIVLRPGKKPRLLTQGGPALGLLDPEACDAPVYEQHDVTLRAGDTAFFFTDGLVDFYNDLELARTQRERLVRFLEERKELPPQELVDQAYMHMLTTAGIQEPTDDVAVLAVRVSPADPPRSDPTTNGRI